MTLDDTNTYLLQTIQTPMPMKDEGEAKLGKSEIPYST